MSDNTLFKDWLTTRDAAKLMGYSMNGVVQLVHRGLLPNSVKVGGMIMIPISDITNFKEEKERKKERRKSKFIVPKRDIGI